MHYFKNIKHNYTRNLPKTPAKYNSTEHLLDPILTCMHAWSLLHLKPIVFLNTSCINSRTAKFKPNFIHNWESFSYVI